VHVTRRGPDRPSRTTTSRPTLRGGGRRHGGTRISAPSGEIHGLVLADGAPARDRFRRIHGYLTEELSAAQAVHASGGRHPDPVAPRRWACIDVVARTLTLGPADAAHPTLTAISQDAWPRLSAATAPPALAGVARGLEERALASRERGELSALPAAALPLAARLPTAVAVTAPAGRQTAELARHLASRSPSWGSTRGRRSTAPRHLAGRRGGGHPLELDRAGSTSDRRGAGGGGGASPGRAPARAGQRGAWRATHP
jgi:hypothetical protein